MAIGARHVKLNLGHLLVEVHVADPLGAMPEQLLSFSTAKQTHGLSCSVSSHTSEIARVLGHCDHLMLVLVWSIPWRRSRSFGTGLDDSTCRTADRFSTGAHEFTQNRPHFPASSPLPSICFSSQLGPKCSINS